MHHTASVSSILLQENRFSPLLAAGFFLVLAMMYHLPTWHARLLYLAFSLTPADKERARANREALINEFMAGYGKLTHEDRVMCNRAVTARAQSHWSGATDCAGSWRIAGRSRKGAPVAAAGKFASVDASVMGGAGAWAAVALCLSPARAGPIAGWQSLSRNEVCR